MYVILCINLVINLIFTEEDTYGSYGKLLLRYYIAEGVINKHDIFFASADCKPESILQVCETTMLCIGIVTSGGLVV